MNDFPRMLYRQPAVGRDALALQDGAYDWSTVADAAGLDAALSEGWHLTPADANEAAQAAQQPEEPADDAPPTRAELEAKAADLGLKFDGRWGDKKLADAIAAALKA